MKYDYSSEIFHTNLERLSEHTGFKTWSLVDNITTAKLVWLIQTDMLMAINFLEIVDFHGQKT